MYLYSWVVKTKNKFLNINWSYDKAGEKIEIIKSNFNTDSFYKTYSFSKLLSTIDKWLNFF